MEPSIFAYIRRHSWRQQLLILGLTLLTFPPLYYSLELPKTIINEALADAEGPYLLFGMPLSQVNYLFALCGMFLALVLIGGGLKYAVNVYAGITAERMLRRLRYDLYGHVLRFPLPHLRRVSQGELVQMINAETEALGGYVGEALATPAFQGGTLLTILFFMFMQDWILGLSAIALYPLQMWLIPKLQRQVNNLGKSRVRQVRRNAERISETTAGVRDIRANDTSYFERARFTDQLGEVFWIRFAIYKKKFLIKFINNFIAQLGPFFFFSIGGYLVIQGQITLGALVAVVGAQKDIASPWKELLTHYQLLYDVKIKYEQTVSQFSPPGLRELRLLDDEPGDAPSFTGELRAANLTLADDGETMLDGVSFSLALPSRVAIVGPAGSGKEELTLLLTGLMAPDTGRVTLNGRDLMTLPESVLGRRAAYVGNPSYVFGASIEDNILYGLKHRPLRPPEIPESERRQRERELLEAKQSGNAQAWIDADWVDDEAAGIEGPEARLDAMIQALRLTLLENDVYLMGLRGTVDVRQRGDLVARLLEARKAMQEQLRRDGRLSRLVETFDPARYNMNATLAENLLFGTPVGQTFAMDELARQPHVVATLDAVGLTDELRRVGLKMAQTMVELFADLPPDHEYFRQFSFIDPEDLPEYRNLVARADPSRLGALSAADLERLMALPFRLIPARHRLDVLNDELIEKVLEARRLFRERLPAEHAGSIAFFDPAEYNEPSSIQDNIIFGKIAYGQAQAGPRVAELITEVLGALDLRERVTEVGLGTEVGVAGARLSPAQRQKVAIARAILKRPEMIVLHDAMGPIDTSEQTRLRDNLLAAFEDRTVIWALQNNEWASQFDRVIVLDRGKLVADGTFDQLDRDGSAFRQLLTAT